MTSAKRWSIPTNRIVGRVVHRRARIADHDDHRCCGHDPPFSARKLGAFIPSIISLRREKDNALALWFEVKKRL
jgi:hypothetical protein